MHEISWTKKLSASENALLSVELLAGIYVNHNMGIRSGISEQQFTCIQMAS